jgi:hypothetical protein
MAPRKPKLTDPVITPDPAPEAPVLTYLANPISVAAQTPRTRDDIALRDAIRARLAVIESVIAEFIAEKTAEGFSMGEIDQLYSLELPVLFGYRADGGRVRVSYDAQIVERQA